MARINRDRTLDSANIPWSPTGDRFCGEASTARFNGTYQLYDDAADEGVWVRTPNGYLAPFVLDKVEPDGDGGVKWWEFKYEMPNGNRYTLILWND